ncbi:MAG: DNA-3-methyladenine glycosylase family protein [Candidatus Levyibacteriota bacterium]
MQLFVDYRLPFAWTELLRFLEGRALSGVEDVSNNTYSRAVSLTRNDKKYEGWISVQNDEKHARLLVTMPENLAPVTAVLLARVRQLFDTNSSPEDIKKQLGKLADEVAGVRVPGAFDGFEMAVRAILGQQITVAGARTLAGRVASALGDPIQSPFETIQRAFPSPQQVVDAGVERLGKLGITRARARTICDLAQGVLDKKIFLYPKGEINSTLTQLRLIKGIGEWTVQYIAMRALEWPDAFPSTDYGVKKALGETNDKIILQKAEKWRPWRAYATMYLWNRLARKEVSV